MSYLGFLDIPAKEMEKYHEDAEKKVGTCRVIPRGRFGIRGNGITYDGLVCSTYDMGGDATGVGASACRNCVLKDDAYPLTLRTSE